MVKCLGKNVFLLCLLFSPQLSFAFDFDPAPLLRQAAGYLDQGRFLECVESYNQVYRYAQDKETKALALVRVADVLALFLDQKDRAISVYTQAIQEFPQAKALNNAYFNSGMLLYELGRIDQAKDRFEKYIRAFPDGHRLFTAKYMLERIERELNEGGQAAEPKDQESTLKNEPWIRVVLSQSRVGKVKFEGLVQIAGMGNQKTLPGGVYSVNLDGEQIVFAGHKLGTKIILKSEENIFYLRNKVYHGQLILQVRRGKILFINYLPLESYLLGVVPKEMSPSWHIQALKAQAVAARSYAYFLILRSEDKEYDVAATTASQVYGGAGVGNTKTRRAVEETRGEILTFNGQPVLTYFHAHSGGMLEDAGLVWSTRLPYYKVTQDEVSQNFKPYFWETRISEDEIISALNKHGFQIQRIKNLVTDKYSSSGRIVEVLMDTGSDILCVKSNSLRIWIGASRIKSTLCRIEKRGDDYLFSGKGYGHGVGMSQWGAQGLANQGQNYRQILNHYYPGTEVRVIY
ncbi:SpoIID/LytB domain-containing protein [Desulfovulcanus sp.]